MANNVANRGSGVSMVLLGLLLILLMSLSIVGIFFLTSDRHHRRPSIFPRFIGGCEGTRWGCCPDGETAKRDSSGWNCDYVPPRPPGPIRPLIGGCAGTRWGCCPDGINTKVDFRGSNCSSPAPRLIGGCAGTRFGCCSDGRTPKQSFDQIC
jgi:hypothetical protein